MASHLEKLKERGQRKLLALDGGGIRGMISIEVLAKIESTLQTELKRGDDFTLAEYFDYIAGTSTGAIIATCLSLGMRVSKIRDFYIGSGEAMFNRAGWLQKFHNKFEDEPLAEKLKEVVGGAETQFGSDTLQTLLMMVLRNATTDSPWPLSNNPNAKYKDNRELPLWQLVRASTAAPTYFPPELIDVTDHQGKKKRFIFVDGGITMYNNPAFQLFLMATVEPYNLNWPSGEDKMLVVSIGTGTAAAANANLRPGEMNLLYNASSIPSALMFAALNEQDFLCRVFGKCLIGDAIDSEVGDMIGKAGPAMPKLFTYARYNAELTREGLDTLKLPNIQPKRVQQLDAVDAIPELREVGKAVGGLVEPGHFAGFLG